MNGSVSSDLKPRVRVSGPAKRDIAAIVKRSFREFGEKAASRYEALLSQAIVDVANDPGRVGSKQIDLSGSGMRVYNLEFSRQRTSGERVKSPRHFLVYRVLEDGFVEVLRVLHDRRDIQRHLPKE